VELVVDAEISSASDPYLEDHVLQKEKLFPAVLGLEAMAQAAMALTGSDQPPAFEQVQLSRPVTVSSSNPTVIRLAALRRGSGLVEVCLRSDQTDFHVNHFSALCRFGTGETGRVRLSSARRENPGSAFPNAAGGSSRPSPLASRPSSPIPRHPSPLPLDARDVLYGRLLFHQGRFCRVRNYRVLTARECIAELAPPNDLPWFGPYLPNELVLGDPGARDAALHALQACVPHQRVLPTGIERLITFQSPPPGRSAPKTGCRFVHARERVRQGDNFIYDLEILDGKGSIVEFWEGLRLRAVQQMTPNRSWPDALLGPYVERRLEELVVPSHARVVLQRNGKPNQVEKHAQDRRAGTDSSLQQAVGRTDRIWRRPDGKPVLALAEGLSAAHALDLTLAVANGKDVACDLEFVTARSGSVWRDLLGVDRFLLAERIGRQRQESPEAAATRMWVASECLKKAGFSAEAPLLLETETADGWVVLRSGALSIATCVLAVAHVQAPLALAVALEASPSRT
jgi:enediyne polyketide synthase